MSIETFDASSEVKPIDPLYAAQKEGVARMRTSLLSCLNDDSGAITSRAINNITVLRIYHQISRIIRYLDLMDKLEDKLYESISVNIDNMNPNDLSTMEVLLSTQAQLQKSMIESHKLLQPYMDLQDMSIVDLMAVQTNQANSETNEMRLLPSESRDKIRNSAQSYLEEIKSQLSEDELKKISEAGQKAGD